MQRYGMTIAFANLELTPKKWPTIQKMAKKGHAPAMYLMGVAYLLGGVVEADASKAFEWFQKAANLGHGDAAFRCGFLIEHKKVESKITPMEWYEKAAKLGSGAGHCSLGNIWTFARLTRQKWWHKWLPDTDSSLDATNAFEHYESATKLNYMPAHYFKGVHYLKGWGVKKSLESAREAFQEGLREKDKDSALALSATYPFNSISYWHHLEQSADWGNPQGQFKLALALLTKKDTTSTKLAITWLKKAAIQRYGKAMLLLSQTLAFEKGEHRDMLTAYRWARRGASLGAVSEQWVIRLYRKLTPEEQQMILIDEDADDAKFHELTQTLFETPGV